MQGSGGGSDSGARQQVSASGQARPYGFYCAFRRQSGEWWRTLAYLVTRIRRYAHLVLACTPRGLARSLASNSRVTVITLPEATNDQSLVMTSSFTNLVLSARFLGLLEIPDQYQGDMRAASAIARYILAEHFGRVASIAKAPFTRAVFLRSGARLTAAREASLKMLEMTSGRVVTLCETFLGLRHGSMSYVHKDCLVVAFCHRILCCGFTEPTCFEIGS